MIKNSPANAGDVGLPLGREDPLGKEPIPVFLLGNPMDRGAWGATVHEVTKVSDTTKQQQFVLYHHL